MCTMLYVVRVPNKILYNTRTLVVQCMQWGSVNHLKHGKELVVNDIREFKSISRLKILPETLSMLHLKRQNCITIGF